MEYAILLLLIDLEWSVAFGLNNSFIYSTFLVVCLAVSQFSATSELVALIKYVKKNNKIRQIVRETQIASKGLALKT